MLKMESLPLIYDSPTFLWDRFNSFLIKNHYPNAQVFTTQSLLRICGQSTLLD